MSSDLMNLALRTGCSADQSPRKRSRMFRCTRSGLDPVVEPSGREDHARSSAADLKFLQALPQTRIGTSNRKRHSNPMLAGAPLLPKFVSEGAAMYHELRKRGTRACPRLDRNRTCCNHGSQYSEDVSIPAPAMSWGESGVHAPPGS